MGMITRLLTGFHADYFCVKHFGWRNVCIMKKKTADNLKFSGVIEGGSCWDELTRERMQDPKSLEAYGYKVYSQNDEDGIIHEIFRRIGATNKTFIEFGVQNGLECNSHLLLFYGWNGLWIEGSDEYCKEIRMKFRPVIDNGQLQIMNSFVTRENINKLLAKYTGGGVF